MGGGREVLQLPSHKRKIGGCICPFRVRKRPFKKEAAHREIVKEPSLDKPTLFKVQIVYAKCLKSHCKVNNFPLSIKGISKYQKATAWLMKKAIASTYPPPPIYRWKRKEADKLNLGDLIRELKP